MRTLSTNSPGCAVLLAVGQEEVFERHGAAFAALAQHQLGAERDQRGGHVADRGAVGDIAADRARVADLQAADAADQLAQIGMEAGERVLRLGIAHARADREAVRRLLDPPQIGDVADEDDRCRDPGGPWSPRARHRWPRRRSAPRDARSAAPPARPTSAARTSPALPGRARSCEAELRSRRSSVGPGGLASPASRIGP